MSKKIIVAEDSSVIQNLTRKILSQMNFEIVSVKNGKQVIDKINSDESFDLVLLDINMPVMDGMECARQIRKLDKNSNIPLIAITGNANNYTMEDFEKVGINAFIPKPLNYDQLVDTVKRFTNAD